jgi:phosphoglycerate dehydrogenase-like enzyme
MRLEAGDASPRRHRRLLTWPASSSANSWTSRRSRACAGPRGLYDAALVDDPAELRRLAADVDALIVRNRTQVRGDLLAAMTRLQVIGRLGVGLDNIDVEACAARGIAVIPATGANALSVAEYVIAAALLLLRGAYQSTTEVAAGHWPRGALSERSRSARPIRSASSASARSAA